MKNWFIFLALFSLFACSWSMEFDDDEIEADAVDSDEEYVSSDSELDAIEAELDVLDVEQSDPVKPVAIPVLGAADMERLKLEAAKRADDLVKFSEKLLTEKRLDKARMKAKKSYNSAKNYVNDLYGRRRRRTTTVDHTQLVTIDKTKFNKGLSYLPPDYAEQIFGKPGKLTTNCSDVTNKKLKAQIVRSDVGPFTVIGHKLAVAAVKRAMRKIKKNDPVIYGKLSSPGMLCVRKIRGRKTFSNHSWGCAIDLMISGDLDDMGDGRTQIGLRDIAKYFNSEGFYWGAGFSREDSMHFECSKQLVQKWKAANKV